MKPAGDEHLGAFVYCASHLCVHSTGWCTVHVSDKIPMPGPQMVDAVAFAMRLGLHFFEHRSAPMTAEERERYRLMHPLAEACGQRHPRSWLIPQPHRTVRDHILRRLAEIKTRVEAVEP